MKTEKDKEFETYIFGESLSEIEKEFTLESIDGEYFWVYKNGEIISCEDDLKRINKKLNEIR